MSVFTAGSSRIRLGAFLTAVALLATLAGGCAGYKNTMERLKDTTTRFNQNVRWQRFEAASKSILPEHREAWVASMERAARTFTIAEFEVKPVDMGSDRAVLHVDLAYFQQPGVVLKHMRRQQVWKQMDTEWYLASDKELPADDTVPYAMPDHEDQVLLSEDLEAQPDPDDHITRTGTR